MDTFPARASPEQLGKDELGLATSWVSDAFQDHPVAVVVLNRFRQVVFANKAAKEAFGAVKADAARGLRPGELIGCVHAKETSGGCGTTASCAFCGAALAIQKALGGEADCRPCRMTRDSGEGIEPLDLEIWTRPFSHAGRDFILFTALDVSAQRRREVLERIFFHDILNTAGGIMTLATLLGESASGSSAELIGFLSGAVDSLVDEIRAQRDLVLAERGELETQPVSFSLRALLEETLPLFKVHFKERKLELKVACPDSSVILDRVIVRRILVNLVKNAVEAEPKDGFVSVVMRPESGSLVLEVSNSAVMGEDVKKQVFSRSFSTKGRGRGIGTWSVKLLSERVLKGTVSCFSEPGSGTTFSARLPELSLER